MDFELASKQMSYGYYVSRTKWANSKLLYIANGHLCEMSSGQIKKADFKKATITFDDLSANDWISVKVERDGKKLSISPGYHKYDRVRFSRLLAKVSPINKTNKETGL